jgi:hypothetical protein
MARHACQEGQLPQNAASPCPACVPPGDARPGPGREPAPPFAWATAPPEPPDGFAPHRKFVPSNIALATRFPVKTGHFEAGGSILDLSTIRGRRAPKENSKHEIRNPKQIRNPKHQCSKQGRPETRNSNIEIRNVSDLPSFRAFEFLSSFGFRVSSFEFPAATAVRICFEFRASNFVLAHVSAIRISRPYGLAFGRTGST